MPLLDGLVQGFAQAQEKQRDRSLVEEFKKTQRKLLDAQVDALITKTQAQQRLADLAGGLKYPTVNGQEGVGPPQQVEKKSLIDILTSPENAGTAIQAGVPVGAIAELQKNQQMMNMFKNFQGADTQGMVSSMTVTPQGPSLSFKPPELTTQTIQTDQGPRIQIFNQRTGKMVHDLGPSKEGQLSAEQAGKLAMLDQAVTDIEQGSQILFPNGQLDKTVLLEMSAPGGGVGKGRTARSLFRNAMNAKLRAETGAQANPSELDDMEKRFMPSPLDLTTDGLPELKMRRLKEFMESAIDISTLPKTLQDKVNKRRGNLPEGVPAGSKQIGTSGGKPVFEAPDGKQYIVD